MDVNFRCGPICVYYIPDINRESENYKSIEDVRKNISSKITILQAIVKEMRSNVKIEDIRGHCNKLKSYINSTQKYCLSTLTRGCKMESKKNPRNVGRKAEFTKEDLLKVIDSYRLEGKLKGRISCSELAKYANEYLGYNDVRYYHFTQNSDVKRAIDKYNMTTTNAFNLDNISDYRSLSNIDMKYLIDTYKDKPTELRYYLMAYKSSVDILIKEYLKVEGDNRHLKDKFEKIEQKKKELQNDNNILLDDNLVLTKTIQKMNYKEMIAALSTLKYVYIPEQENIKFDSTVEINVLNEENGSSIKN